MEDYYFDTVYPGHLADVAAQEAHRVAAAQAKKRLTIRAARAAKKAARLALVDPLAPDDPKADDLPFFLTTWRLEKSTTYRSF